MDETMEEVPAAAGGLTGDDVYFAVRDAVQDVLMDVLPDGVVEVVLSPEQVSDLADSLGSSVSDAISETEMVPAVAENETPETDEEEELDSAILSEIRTHVNTMKTAVASIQQSVIPHPVLTTDFEDYTVTEGLLLLILLFMFMKSCVRIIREGFSWLG